MGKQNKLFIITRESVSFMLRNYFKAFRELRPRMGTDPEKTQTHTVQVYSLQVWRITPENKSLNQYPFIINYKNKATFKFLYLYKPTRVYGRIRPDLRLPA